MSTFVAVLAYVLAIALDLAAILLALEWVIHFLPGGWLNFARRRLFNATFPLLKWNDRFLAVKWGAFDPRGLLLAFVFLMVSRYGVPWLVLLSYSLRS